MKRTAIINGKVILPLTIAKDKVVVVEGAKIEKIIDAADYKANEYDKTIDAKGKYVSPGFIDLHIHGGGGYDFMDGSVEAILGAAEAHAKYGTTSLYPTTMTSSNSDLWATFDNYREAIKENTKGANLMGLHLEGPFFSAEKCGAQPPEYLQLPIPENYMPMLDYAEDIIARVSVAPELEGALEFGRELTKRGILASVAHTDASFEQVVEAYNYGYTHFTHFYSAMSSVVKRNGRRYAGAVEAGYLLDDATVEVIGDGIHLPYPFLQYIYKFKGASKIALCTDSMRGACMPDGPYKLGSLKDGVDTFKEGGVARLTDHKTLAGSVCTTDRLVRTMMAQSDASLHEAVVMASATPAHIMRVDDRKGSIAAGKDADIIIFDEDINIAATMVMGNVVYTKE